MHRCAALWAAWAASIGCASALQRGAEAYERGDFRVAHELLAWVEPGEGEELRAAVAAGIDYSTSYLLDELLLHPDALGLGLEYRHRAPS